MATSQPFCTACFLLSHWLYRMFLPRPPCQLKSVISKSTVSESYLSGFTFKAPDVCSSPIWYILIFFMSHHRPRTQPLQLHKEVQIVTLFYRQEYGGTQKLNDSPKLTSDSRTLSPVRVTHSLAHPQTRLFFLQSFSLLILSPVPEKPRTHNKAKGIQYYELNSRQRDMNY